ncbi:unannotated protein [freshwater metagenome]|uniref:Unannotated protein n=1 Tax=freshwater metagenome TaxID=449393 RepID=A0A6J7PAT2_9ZZZZ
MRDCCSTGFNHTFDKELWILLDLVTVECQTCYWYIDLAEDSARLTPHHGFGGRSPLVNCEDYQWLLADG